MARGSVRPQLSEAQGTCEGLGRNPLVNPDVQEGNSEGVASSLTKGLAPYARGNIRVDPLESGCVGKWSQPITVSLDL